MFAATKFLTLPIQSRPKPIEMSLRSLCSTSNTFYRSSRSITCFDHFHAYGPVPTEAVRKEFSPTLTYSLRLWDDRDALVRHDNIARPEAFAPQTPVTYNEGGSLSLIEPTGNFQPQEGTEQQIVPTSDLSEDAIGHAISDDEIADPPKSHAKGIRSAHRRLRSSHSPGLVQNFTTCQTSCEEFHCLTIYQPDTTVGIAGRSSDQSASQRNDEIPYSLFKADDSRKSSNRTLSS